MHYVPQVCINMTKDDEILYLLRENNYMLKQIIQYINKNGHQNDMKEFMINVLANSM